MVAWLASGIYKLSVKVIFYILVSVCDVSVRVLFDFTNSPCSKSQPCAPLEIMCVLMCAHVSVCTCVCSHVQACIDLQRQKAVLRQKHNKPVQAWGHPGACLECVTP